MSGARAAHRLTAERVKLLAGAARIVSASAKPQMKVPFLDLKAHHAPLIDQFDRAIRKVIESSAFAGGPFVEEFEEEFAAYCGSLYAIGVGNGTDALWLTLMALGIGPGDEVITVPNTFFATAEAITYCRAQPVFVDVDENTFTMNQAELKKALTARTKAIIPVHLFGQPANMDPILEFADGWHPGGDPVHQITTSRRSKSAATRTLFAIQSRFRGNRRRCYALRGGLWTARLSRLCDSSTETR